MDNYKHRVRKALVISLVFTLLILIAGGYIVFQQPDMLLPAAAIGVAVIFINISYLLVSNRLQLAEIFADLKGEMDESFIASVLDNPYPVCMIDSKGIILWYNASFRMMFHAEENTGNRKISDMTGIKMHLMSNEELSQRIVWMSSIKRYFRVFATEYATEYASQVGVPEQAAARSEQMELSLAGYESHQEAVHETPADQYKLRMLHWMDITDYELLKKTHDEEKACVVHIRLDNLDDILEQAPDDRKAALSGEIEKLIRQWAIKSRGALIRVSKMKFVLVCDHRNLDNTMQNKFPILDEVRELPTGGDLPASLSIGVGTGGKTLTQTDEFAQGALDLALGRGGDQAVVSSGENIEYFGGRQLAGGKRNKGRSRTVSGALLQLIDQSERVFIMGHKLPDMDAFGASVGLARMVRSREKEAYIIVNSNKAIEEPYRLAQASGEYNIIQSEQAINLARRDDLVVLVDTHRPSLADCGELLDLCERIVIIDHHRKNPDIVKNPVLLHLEPYASSACELVTEMIQYTITGKKPLSELEASLLLSGLALDTRNFSIKTGVPTFDAASWLKRQGANTIEVRRFFQTDIVQFREKAGIIASIERLEGDMVVGFLRKPGPDVSVLISSVADQLLEIRGMKASFVLGIEPDNTIRISARSLGQINVQLIMEKIGGGGNLTTAGAQLKMSFDEALEHLKQAIDRYVSEAAEAELKEQQKQKEQQRQRDLRKTRELREKEQKEAR